MTKIFSPKGGKNMRVAVFFSGGASAFKSMLDDPNYGKLYEVVVGVTNDEKASGKEAFGKNIPVLDHPLKFPAFDVEAAKSMYEEVLRGIEPYHPDLIALCGFMRIVTHPIIEHGDERGEYSGRIFNVHPADLSILENPPDVKRLYAVDSNQLEAGKIIRANGLRRKYKGEDAVYDAITSGERETRSTIHVATEDFDEGPILVQSRPFPVPDKYRKLTERRNFRPVRTFADKLQNEMKDDGDGPAYLKALELTATGRFGLLEEGAVYLDKKEKILPYHGIRL